ncbi:MAG: TIGR02588 family protein [Elainellaceae cyanobacterium]
MSQNNLTDSQPSLIDSQASEPLSKPRSRRSLAEWITFTIAALILSALVGLIIYDWQVNQSRPPAFQVEVTESARVTDGRYYVPFSIQNTGGRIARTVQVTAELLLENGDNESGEQQIDFLSGNERKSGSFVFSHNPQQGELLIRVASYGLP